MLLCVLLSLFSWSVQSEGSKVELRESGDEGKSSLVFVFDTTGSMHNDLRQLKDSAEMILNTALEQSNIIEDFAFVPFHDPVVGPATVTRQKSEFKAALDRVRVYGGGDCPEKSLGGIRLALNVSRPRSFIYVFTDATASDHRLVGNVLDMVQRKQSQVVFVLTGHCNDLHKPSYQVYEQIAAASSGQVFILNKTNVHKVLEMVRTSLKGRNVNLGSVVLPAGYNHTQGIPVDSSVAEVTVSVSGSRPSITVVDPKGHELTGPPQLVTTLDLSEIMVVKVLEPEAGNWSIVVGSAGEHSVRVAALSNLTFDCGFSVAPPSAMAETSRRPLKSAYNHMMVSVTNAGPPVKMEFAEILDLAGRPLFEVPLNIKEGSDHIYTADAFIPPDDFFYVAINGHDETNQQLRRVGATAVQAKLPDVPFLTAPRKIDVSRHGRVTLRCDVESLVPVSAMWIRDSRRIQPLITSLQSTSVEFVIEDAGEEDAGSYRCFASNVAGQATLETEVELQVDPPEVKVQPGNTTLLLGEKLTVSCHVFSEALLTRMQMMFTAAELNHTDVSNIDITPREDGLYTYNKTIAHVDESQDGIYTCEAANRGGVTLRSMNVTVQSRPMVQILGPHDVKKLRHSSIQLICHVENADRVQWKAPNGSVIMDLQVNSTYNGMYEVRNLTEGGRWTCYGSRGPYAVSDSIEIDILIKPTVRIAGAKNLTILNGTGVELACDIVAKPTPRIIWHRETESFLNHTITSSRDNVYRSVLSLNSSTGSVEATYFCIAENPLGIAEDSVAVNVRRAMTVVQGFSDSSVELYSQLDLQCDVDTYPPPRVRWSHNGTELVTNTNVHLADDNATLTILMVDFDDLGRYQCEADNGYERVKVDGALSVVGLEAPALWKEPAQITARKDQSTKLTCRVTRGKPEPFLSWQYRGKSSEEFNEVPPGATTNEDASELIVRKLLANHSGVYRCVAENIIATDVYEVELIVQYPPEVLKPPNAPSGEGKLDIKAGEPVRLSCEAIGDPMPIVVWTRNKGPVAYSSNVYLNGDDLVIEKTSENDSGLYTCTATSALGSSQKNFTLFIYVPPTVSPSDVGPEVDALEGQLVELPCDAHAVPSPTVRWLYEGKDIDDARKYIDEFGIRFVANLTDFGNYTCLIENEYGNLSVPFFLYIWVAPTVQLQDATKSVVVGNNVSMTCDAVGFPVPTISWEFRENELVANTTHVSFNDIGNLYFSNVSTREEGVYTCIATNLAGADKKSTRLIVNEPPAISKGALSGPYLATDNDKELIIPCNVTGKPKPYVAWKKDGKYLINDGTFVVDYDGTLTINSPKEHMSGTYVCVGKNAGEANKTVQVEIYSVPTQLQAEASEVTVSVVEGTNVSIECPVRASPRDVVKWYKDAKLVSEGALLIPNVSRANSSQYACAVTNIAGSAFCAVSVIVEWPPRIGVSGQDVEVIRGNDWYFDCEADAKPRAKITWLFNNKVMIFEDRERLKVLNLEMHHSGTYECVASNVHGSARALYTLDVLVPPFISEFDLLEVQLKEGSDAVLDCDAKGSPQPQVKWTYNNTEWKPVASSLSSRNLTADAEGLFRCDATNKAGSAYIVYNVSVVSAARVREVVAYVEGEGYTVLERIEAVQGGRMRIACISSGRPTPKIQWIKSGNTLSENSDGAAYADLIIFDVKTTDAGVYACVVSNDGSMDERKIRLEVLEQPRIFQALFQDRPTGNTVNLEVLAGQAFSMHCHPYGNPQPEVYWFKDDVPLRLFNDKMVSADYGEVIASKAALYEQTGNYTCVARNKIGNTSLVYLVDVLVPPPAVKDSIRKVNTRGGRVVKLSCPVGGSPTPHVLWLRHPYGEIEHTPRISLSEDNSTLTINGTEVSDSGNYSCVMTNKVGTTEVIFDVTIDTPPSIAGNVGADIVESHVVPMMRSIVLKCDAKGHPSPAISWLKDTQQIRDESSNVHRVADSSLLTLWRVSVKTAGQYICLAENVAGTVHRRYNVAVTVPGKWSAWSAWGYCNVTCGQGFQHRQRGCQYVDDDTTYDKTTNSDKIILDETECKGSATDKRRCHMPPCEEPQTSRWARWSRWSQCSATCGSGSQTRIRRCLSAVPCYGDNVQIRKCPNLPKCELATSEKRDVEATGSKESDSDAENPYAPEETFEMQPELLNANKHRHVEDVDVFDNAPMASTLFHEVNVTGNLDFSEPGPCRPGFTHNATANTCDDIDECTIEYNACHSTQVCANSEGGYRCGCEPGYTSIAAGTRCLDVNECERGVAGCEVACVNVAGGYVCACPKHLRLHMDGHHCVLPSLYRDPYLFQDVDTGDYLSAYIDLPPKHSKKGRS